MKIFSGSSNKPLAENIAKELNLHLSPVEIFVFPDGERRIRFEEEVVDEDVVIVQSTASPVDAHYVELFFLIDAANRSGAKSVTVIMPYLGYMRQDHVFRSGEAVSFQVMVRILESLGVDHVIACDLHTVKIPQMFHVSFTEVSALSLFAKEIINNGWNDKASFLVSPDMGGLRRIHKISEFLNGMGWVATVKHRDLASGSIAINEIEGDKNTMTDRALIVDDMISSGKTMVQAAELLQKHGAKEIYAFITHPIFSADAPQRLQNSVIQKVFVTDSVAIPEEKQFEKLEVISIANDIAKGIKRE